MTEDWVWCVSRIRDIGNRILALEKEQPRLPLGCICPPLSEKTCQGVLCPRRKMETL